MFFVYILKSVKDGKLYVGYTSDVSRRYKEHIDGLVESTKNRRPLKLIYYQAFIAKQDAINEEKYLKSGGKAKNGLKLRISESLKI